MIKESIQAVAGAALVLAAGAAGAQDIPVAAYVTESGKFSIANTLAYAPFEYMDEAGKPAGMSVELAQAAAEVLGVELEINPIPFASLIPSLTAGRVKVAWATASVTEERLGQVDFVAHMQTGTVVSTLPENVEKFADRNNLCGNTVAVQTGTAADFAADRVNDDCKAAGLAEINKAIYPSQQDTVQSVITGRADVYLEDATAAGYYSKISDGRLMITGESFSMTPIGHIVAKGDTETAEMIAALVQRLMDDGTYAAALEKYGMTFAALDRPVIYTDVSQLRN